MHVKLTLYTNECTLPLVHMQSEYRVTLMQTSDCHRLLSFMILGKEAIYPEIKVSAMKEIVLKLLVKCLFRNNIYSRWGSFNETHKTLSGQGLKAICKLSQYLYKFTDLSPKHVLDLFDKLFCVMRLKLLLLLFCCCCFGDFFFVLFCFVFSKINEEEMAHLLFCKTLLGVNRTTQNDFIYCEIGITETYPCKSDHKFAPKI